ncbi:GntR family transcriptional regulator [Rhodopseudomonas palustris]|uniref:GntR family transcriptional regulator n=1 Tax=Rhodopseudomonas palustris TaxID=1076 RepID=A0A418UY79_RHOPL|nr:GntR family transcriptional regulator [Rhodopseudomonas palustris]RJF67410.1 GntR family transcriptional regulator [Rhodopseudomonas palustris]
MISTFTNDNGRAVLIYREIKRRITELVYQPGDKLSEVRIASELGCGRSPVRTAFARLQSEGWIEISPQSGTFVRGLSDVEITEILEARMLLEAHLAGRAATRMEEATIARFRKAFAALGKRVSSDRMDEYLELDLQFHLAIYQAAANKVLAEVLLNLVDKVRWIRVASKGSPTRISSAVEEIGRVLDALEARDERAAAAAMRGHIENTMHFRHLGGPAETAAKTAPRALKNPSEQSSRKAR